MEVKENSDIEEGGPGRPSFKKLDQPLGRAMAKCRDLILNLPS